ncbi:hypothetical protein HAX54_023461 [Datura stramonium]|uniref:C-22 sterol desaturase n=1 Tax=Datura stramonium TaxID=4076 RepID=A0ABS8S515_DATST|nr:hypothetical protein [Datura stramonium]
MSGKKHKDIRRLTTTKFTPKALAAYTAIQQKIIKINESWLMRHLNQINPTAIPHPKHELGNFPDHSPHNNNKLNGLQNPPKYTHKELGGHLFDFLFASQDASTSSLLWAVAILDSYPRILEKVRTEVARFWSPECDEPLTGDMLREMKYLEAVALEVLRFRPPAPMVPHLTSEEFRLTDDYVIPKGTIVFPSVTDSCLQGFPEAEKFDPDRFMEERQEERFYKKNFLVFGTGPHACLGQRYAINLLMLFIAIFTASIDFKRHKTHGCDDTCYIPASAPMDHCKVFLSKRRM